MSLNAIARRGARLAFHLPLLLGMPAVVAAQPVRRDGDFAQWATVAGPRPVRAWNTQISRHRAA
jgi:hypothetical protein